MLFGGIILVGFGALFSIAPAAETPNATGDGFGSIGPFFGIIFLLIGAVLLVIGIAYVVMSYGLLKGRGWAWTITVILTIIGIAIQIISGITNSVLIASISGGDPNSVVSTVAGNVIGIAINVLILYYLYRPHVKAFFGKSSIPTTQ